MKTYTITEESKKAAENRFRHSVKRGDLIYASFADALDALCVEVKEGKEEWEEELEDKFTKGPYTLYVLRWSWELLCSGLRIAATGSCGDARTWADEEIAKYEAKQQPKSFGPGTRLRAANGDELVIFKGTTLISTNVFWGVLNLTTMSAERAGSNLWYFEKNLLKDALLAFGATIIED